MAELMHFAFILVHAPAPHSAGAWRLTRSFRGFCFSEPAYWEHLAREMERGKLDLIFLADGYQLHDRYKDSPDTAVRYAVQFPVHDPMPLVAIMSRVTERLGLGVTATTTFTEPYSLARLLGTLDHLSEGRVGWNVVTSFGETAAANFGKATIMDHDARYDRANEYMEVVYKLWDSWAPDALVEDRASGVWADPAKVRRIDHVGTHFRCRGPLSVIRSPQGRPVIIQAGASPQGIAFAAKHAELIFAVRGSTAGMRSYRQMLNEALLREGRKPGDAKVLWGVCPYVGETEAEAQAKYQRVLDAVPPEAGLTLLSGHLNYDLSQLPLDAPLSHIETEGIRGVLDMVTQDFGDVSLREAAQRYALSVGVMPVIGTPEQVADRLEELYEAGQGDGFMLVTHELPESVSEFVDMVIPVLQARGRARMAYEGTTLRAHLAQESPGRPTRRRAGAPPVLVTS